MDAVLELFGRSWAMDRHLLAADMAGVGAAGAGAQRGSSKGGEVERQGAYCACVAWCSVGFAFERCLEGGTGQRSFRTR